MSKLILTTVFALISLLGFSQSSSSCSYTDVYGNKYKSSSNLTKDQDKDGVINLYDRHDKNPNINYSTTPTNTNSSYYSNYKSTSYDANTDRTIYTGSQGGQYYINSNGNKTFIRKK